MIDYLIQKLNQIATGPAWHGPDAIKIFEKSMDPDLKLGNHSVAGILHHINHWKKFTIRNLDRQYQFDEPWSKDLDFSKHNFTIEEFNKLKKEYFHLNSVLVSLLKDFPEDKLSDKIPDRKYNFLYLLSGIIDHDIYHLGQMAYLVSSK